MDNQSTPPNRTVARVLFDQQGMFILRLIVFDQKVDIPLTRTELDALIYSAQLSKSDDIRSYRPQGFGNEKPRSHDNEGSEPIQYFPATIEDFLNDESRRVKAEVSIYIPGDDFTLKDTEDIVNAAGALMEAMGFELKAEEEPIHSSFWKKLSFVFKKNVTAEEIEKVYLQGREALELKYLKVPTADRTEKLAKAGKDMVDSLSNVKQGVIRLGDIIVLKIVLGGETEIIVTELSPHTKSILSQHPDSIKNLGSIYRAIAMNNDSNDLDPASADDAVTA